MQNFDAPDTTTDISNLGTIIRNNIIRYNAENAIDLKGAAHVVIEGNVIYGTVGDNNGSNNGNDRNTLATIMRGSRASTRDVIIRRNIIYDNSSGLKLYDGFKLYNNTIAANNRDYTGSNSDYSTKSEPQFWGLRQFGDRIAIQNNIIIGHNIVEVVIRHASSGQSALNHNLYFNNDGPFFAVQSSKNEWHKLSFDEWKAHLQSADFIFGKDEESIVADPMFVNAPSSPIGEHSKFDFRLQAESPAIDAGGPLTWVKGSGSGISITVDDAGYFFDGYGITEGDLIQIGTNEQVRITAINYGRNIITVERVISWGDRMGVNLIFHGESADIGATEFTGTKPTMFVDVALDHPYYDEIKALFLAGYTAGCNKEPLKFCPDKAMTRAESAVFVERGLWGKGYLPSNPATQLFADLPLESWASKWAHGLALDGYSNGCGSNPLIYCPWQEHSRAEGTVFYMRMLNGPDYVPPTPTGIFTDIPIDYWGTKWAEAAYNTGLIPPCLEQPLKFCPNDPLIRALAAHMMFQAKGLE